MTKVTKALESPWWCYVHALMHTRQLLAIQVPHFKRPGFSTQGSLQDRQESMLSSTQLAHFPMSMRV